MSTDVKEFVDRLDETNHLLIYVAGAGHEGHVCLFVNRSGIGEKFWIKPVDVIEVCNAIHLAATYARQG